MLPIDKQFCRLLLSMSCFLFTQRSNGANIGCLSVVAAIIL